VKKLNTFFLKTWFLSSFRLHNGKEMEQKPVFRKNVIHGEKIDETSKYRT